MGFESEDVSLLLVYLEPIVSERLERDSLETALGHVEVDEIDVPAPLFDLPSVLKDFLIGPPAEKPEAETVELLERQRVISCLQLY